MATSLDSYVGHTVAIVTQDGRMMVGTLKGFDQTVNLILDESHERVFSANSGVNQVFLGLYIIRGDNVAMIGEVDDEIDSGLDMENIKAEPLNHNQILQNMSAKKFVDDCIANNVVMVFSKTYCPFCTMAKKALQDAGLKDFKVVEIENRDDCSQIQDYLRSITGSRTVPQVFINKKYIGGGTECKQYQQQGKLAKFLKDAGAL
eukprot:gene6275-6996_t